MRCPRRNSRQNFQRQPLRRSSLIPHAAQTSRVRHHSSPVQKERGVLQLSVNEMASQLQDIRKDLEQDEMVASMMAGLRGTHIDNSNFADEGPPHSHPSQRSHLPLRSAHAFGRSGRQQRSKRPPAPRLRSRPNQHFLVEAPCRSRHQNAPASE